MRKGGAEPVLIGAAERWMSKSTNGEKKSPRSGRFFRVAGPDGRGIVQVKVFVLPLKNLAEAEAEMNGFLRKEHKSG